MQTVVLGSTPQLHGVGATAEPPGENARRMTAGNASFC